MSFVSGPFVSGAIVAVVRRIGLIAAGIAAIGGLAGLGVGAVFSGGGTVGERLSVRLLEPEALRRIFAVLRAFAPVVSLRRRLVRSYDNTGTTVVSRYDDVVDVLNRDGDFEAVYAPRMGEITDGGAFILGMRDTPRYTRDITNMSAAMRRTDVDELVAPLVARTAAERVAASAGSLDVPQDLTLPVPAAMVADYFGVPGPSPGRMIEWTTIMFRYLFTDLAADDAVREEALLAARECRSCLDDLIQQRKTALRDAPAALHEADTVLDRFLMLQGAGAPGMSDADIRNNLLGLIIGAIPTLSTAAVRALDQLMQRPRPLATAQAAARAGDMDTVTGCVHEGLRFNPIQPIIYRRARHDAVIARSTWRARTIRKGTMVFASNLSAMFDPLEIPTPNRFMINRPWRHYILWGHGLHICFGRHINKAVLPAILTPLLRQKNLRRADGADGRIMTENTPFPVHWRVRFDPSP